jgi:Tfp pilus assembly protein PilN
MKHINFVDSVPRKKQTEAHLWATLTLVIMISGALLLLITHSFQLYEWITQRRELKALQPKIDQLNAHVKKQTELAQKKEEIELRTQRMKQKIEQAKNPLDHMQTIISACAGIQIQSLNLDTQRMALNGACAKPEDAVAIVQKLNQSAHFKNVTLASVQPYVSYQKKSYEFKIQADVNRNKLI